MDYLIQLGTATKDNQPITRDLADGADYRPDWRFRVCEHYLVTIAEAENESATADALLKAERDFFVKQLLAYQLGRPATVHSGIRYALSLRSCPDGARLEAAIQAMILANRSSKEIAQEVGTRRAHIQVYQKLCFDVRGYREHRTWLTLAFDLPNEAKSAAYRQCACYWKKIALRHGWAALAAVLSASLYEGPRYQCNELADFIRPLWQRCGDVIKDRQVGGILPSELDLQLLGALGLVLRRFKLNIDLPRLAYPKPQTIEQQKGLEEADKLVKKIPLSGRRKLGDLLQKLVWDATAEEREAKLKAANQRP